MTVLLDTHTFLWAIAEPARLSRRVTSLLLDDTTELVLSAVSLWEIVLKIEAGKLNMPAHAEYFETHMRRLGVARIMAIAPTHVYAELKLPPAHRDPFDRLLAAQCVVEHMPIVSADPAFPQYPIQVFW